MPATESFRFRSSWRVLIIGIGNARTTISIIRSVYALAVSRAPKSNRPWVSKDQALEIGLAENRAA
jgi:hypothetical protein